MENSSNKLFLSFKSCAFSIYFCVCLLLRRAEGYVRSSSLHRTSAQRSASYTVGANEYLWKERRFLESRVRSGVGAYARIPLGVNAMHRSLGYKWKALNEVTVWISALNCVITNSTGPVCV